MMGFIIILGVAFLAIWAGVGFSIFMDSINDINHWPQWIIFTIICGPVSWVAGGICVLIGLVGKVLSPLGERASNWIFKE